MKVILISAMHNLGKIGDVVEVKNGYAKNFLIPGKKAICYNASNFKIFESKKQEFEQQNQDQLSLAKKIKDKIFGKNIIVIQSASDDGRLYGSVTTSVIADKANEVIAEKSISRSDIFLKKPIKETGVYNVKFGLHSELTFEVKVVVTRSESEVESLLKAEKKSSKNSVDEEVVSENNSSENQEEQKSSEVKKSKKAKE
jgi:large subunit ribosomal protein L9